MGIRYVAVSIDSDDYLRISSGPCPTRSRRTRPCPGCGCRTRGRDGGSVRCHFQNGGRCADDRPNDDFEYVSSYLAAAVEFTEKVARENRGIVYHIG